MASARERRAERSSTARQRAESHSSGFATTTLNMPEGLRFFEAEEGIRTVDIVPYKVGKGNPFVKEGLLHFERTFWVYRRIGADEKAYVCSSKTFGKPDFIQEFRKSESRNPNSDPEYLKSLEPKERQIFLIWDHKDKDKGVQLLEMSYHLFGKLLDDRIKKSPEHRGWDQFYYPDDLGFSLDLTFTKEKNGQYSFLEVSAIDFLERDSDLPKEIVNHGYCLDDMLVETPYEELKRIFLLGEAPEDDVEKKDEKREKREEEKSERRRERERDYDDRKDREKDKEDRSERSERREEKREEPREEKKKKPTAEDLGIKKNAEVWYKGSKHDVFRISDDGLELILVDKDGELVRNISVSDVDKKPPENESRSKKKDDDDVPFDEDKKSRSKEEKSSKSDKKDKDDDSWDKGW